MSASADQKQIPVIPKRKSVIFAVDIHAVYFRGIPAEFKETVPLPLAVRGAVKFPRQAQFHPLKFLFALAKDLPVFEVFFA